MADLASPITLKSPSQGYQEGRQRKEVQVTVGPSLYKDPAFPLHSPPLPKQTHPLCIPNPRKKPGLADNAQSRWAVERVEQAGVGAGVGMGGGAGVRTHALGRRLERGRASEKE